VGIEHPQAIRWASHPSYDPYPTVAARGAHRKLSHGELICMNGVEVTGRQQPIHPAAHALQIISLDQEGTSAELGFKPVADIARSRSADGHTVDGLAQLVYSFEPRCLLWTNQ
jgi:hypothetical protein